MRILVIDSSGTFVNVILSNSGPNQQQVVKLLQTLVNTSKQGAKGLIALVPVAVLRHAPLMQAQNAIDELRKVGATCYLE